MERKKQYVIVGNKFISDLGARAHINLTNQLK